MNAISRWLSSAYSNIGSCRYNFNIPDGLGSVRRQVWCKTDLWYRVAAVWSLYGDQKIFIHLWFSKCSDQLVVCSFAYVCVYRNLTLLLDQDNSQVFVFLLFYSKTNFEMIAGFEQSYLPFSEFIIL